jgi:hypothetical protein
MSLSDPVLIIIIGSATALIGLGLKICYSSKCTHIKLGCIDIDRDTAHEVAINMSASPQSQNV